MAASNLTVRLGTAVVGVPAILALLYLGPAWGFFILIAAAACVGAFELFTGLKADATRMERHFRQLLAHADRRT